MTQLDAGLIGRAGVVLGAGRDTVDADIDPAVGIMIPATVGDAIHCGDPVLRILYRDDARLRAALPLLTAAIGVDTQRKPASPLIIDEVR